LVRLNWFSEVYKANIYAKLELHNPSGSIKDRVALFMIEEGEKKGLIKSGCTLIECSSGNTGASLAMIAAVKGYKTIITVPDKMSQEKITIMKSLGAEVIMTSAEVNPDSQESYYNVAKRISKEIPNSYFTDQCNNPQNIETHYRTTGPEIWEQMEGKIDIFITGAGTGGTITGIGRFLKERNPKIQIIAVDPQGSVYYQFFKNKDVIAPQQYFLEGIGEDYLCKSLDFSIIDDFLQVSDKDSFLTARQLARKEGIFAGGSSGSSLFGAMQLAGKISENKNIVVLFPDSGNRYISKLYNDDWMTSNGFL